MPALPTHLHAVNFLTRSLESRLTITGCLLRGASGLVIRRKRGDIGVAINITTSYPPLARMHMGLLCCASGRTHIEHLHAQNQNSSPWVILDPKYVHQKAGKNRKELKSAHK